MKILKQHENFKLLFIQLCSLSCIKTSHLFNILIEITDYNILGDKSHLFGQEAVRDKTRLLQFSMMASSQTHYNKINYPLIGNMLA